MDRKFLENMSLLDLLVLKRDVCYVLNKKANAENNVDCIVLPEIFKSFYASFNNDDVYKVMVSSEGKLYGITDYNSLNDDNIIFGKVNYSFIVSLFKMKIVNADYKLYTGRFNIDSEFGIIDLNLSGAQNWKEFSYDIDDKLFIYNFSQISEDDGLYKSIIDENIYGIEDDILNLFNNVSTKGQVLKHILSRFNS